MKSKRQQSFSPFVLALVSGLSLRTPSAHATVYYVNGNVTASGAGTSWNTAFKTIQEITPFTSPALAPGDEIWVAGATTLPYDAGVTAYDSVKMYGGFPPAGTPAFAVRNPSAYPTVIDGANIATVGLTVENGANNATIIDGFVIQSATVFGIQNGNTSAAQFLEKKGRPPFFGVLFGWPVVAANELRRRLHSRRSSSDVTHNRPPLEFLFISFTPNLIRLKW